MRRVFCQLLKLLTKFSLTRDVITNFVESYKYVYYKEMNNAIKEQLEPYQKTMKKLCKRAEQIENNQLSEKNKEKFDDLLEWYNEKIIDDIHGNNMFHLYVQQIHEWMMKNKGPYTQMLLMSYIEITCHQFLPTETIYYFFKYCF